MGIGARIFGDEGIEGAREGGCGKAGCGPFEGIVGIGGGELSRRTVRPHPCLNIAQEGGVRGIGLNHRHVGSSSLLETSIPMLFISMRAAW